MKHGTGEIDFEKELTDMEHKANRLDYVASWGRSIESRTIDAERERSRGLVEALKKSTAMLNRYRTIGENGWNAIQQIDENDDALKKYEESDSYRNSDKGEK
jgi:3-deoxy-D-arabino-heptulosonate 7-phosphate (DAHP) synthase class II